MTTIAQFPDRRHAVHMDSVGEQVRDLTQRNDDLTYAERIAILELVKFDIMRDMQRRFGVDEE